MSREQLESVATGLNLKNIKKKDDQDLAFDILDAQAKAESLKPDESKPKAKLKRNLLRQREMQPQAQRLLLQRNPRLTAERRISRHSAKKSRSLLSGRLTMSRRTTPPMLKRVRRRASASA